MNLPAEIDERLFADAVAEVNALLGGDAGGIEILGVSPGGVVKVRFIGMCVACPAKPLTLSATVRATLRKVPGVTGVEATGARVSDEAQLAIVQSLRRAAEVARALVG